MNNVVRILTMVLFIVFLVGCADKGVDDEAALEGLLEDEAPSNNNDENDLNNTFNSSQNESEQKKPSSTSNKKETETRKKFPAGFNFEVIGGGKSYEAGFITSCVDDGKRCNAEIKDHDKLLERFVKGDDSKPVPRLKVRTGDYITFQTSARAGSGDLLPMPDQIELIQIDREEKDIKTELDVPRFEASEEKGRYNYVVRVRWNLENVFKGEALYAFSVLVTE
ncbi:hypothetical protein JNUCC1_02547 [Lentibacillus sp. JNUCC-1]|uniref:hypothetical protein n=1 Tax=Lentibacillus sp. JNUCC-1 TaxID=2654513 RepID=UPI0012E702E5|nr:hypothetical protein [Lentibacillus sp. JNUCC-1]MUV38693.1 hypothetical protein [Lentibacillus sp. JNUCC-1]